MEYTDLEYIQDLAKVALDPSQPIAERHMSINRIYMAGRDDGIQVAVSSMRAQVARQVKMMVPEGAVLINEEDIHDVTK